MAKQEVVTKEAQQMSLSPELMGSWDTDTVEAKDIRIPRALLMQSTSDLVGQRKATAGDVVNSITAEKLADEKTPLEIVPIYTFKTWTVEHKVNGKYEFLKTEPYTPSNSTRPREEKILDVDYQNIETINLLAMRKEDLAKGDSLPILMSFRMTSYACGKDILTLKTNCQRVNKPFPAYTIKLAPEYKKNDKGQFFVMKFLGAAPTEDFATHAMVLKTWHDTFKSGAAKVDEEAPEVMEATETVVPEQRF